MNLREKSEELRLVFLNDRQKTNKKPEQQLQAPEQKTLHLDQAA
jgi:hypothetical protein